MSDDVDSSSVQGCHELLSNASAAFRPLPTPPPPKSLLPVHLLSIALLEINVSSLFCLYPCFPRARLDQVLSPWRLYCQCGQVTRFGRLICICIMSAAGSLRHWGCDPDLFFKGYRLAMTHCPSISLQASRYFWNGGISTGKSAVILERGFIC